MNLPPLKSTIDLDDLLRKAKARYDSMSKEEQDAMWKAQREGYVKAEMSWPAPNFHWEPIDGQLTKVYHSMEDYYND